MSAYVIAEVEITDLQLFAEYGKGVPATIAGRSTGRCSACGSSRRTRSSSSSRVSS